MSVQSFTHAADTLLNISNIQGDILVGLQKDAEMFLFFTIKDATAFKARLPTLVALITSTKSVMDREQEIKAEKASGSGKRLDLRGLNLGFTAPGLDKLVGRNVVSTNAMIDPSFVAGAKARADVLGDEVNAWLPPFQGTAIDGVMLVAGPDEAKVKSHATSIVQLLGAAIEIVHEELGLTRPQRGHEHFGFLDGVSQPGVRGLTPPMNPNDSEQGLPGQDLIHPGEFVFGYPGQVDRFDPQFPDATKETTGPIVEPPFAWMNDGAYMVFRRLEQRVLAFRTFVKEEARALGMDEGLLAARLVGRWPSGAPLVLAPLQDDIALGSDATKNNHFEFQHDDAFQRRCPYAAHIRKTYPRDDLNDAPGIPGLTGEGGEASVQTRRLRRAGIPFGSEVEDSEAVGSEASRGLMFVCYQTSFVDQFEFVQKDWANSDTFIFGKTRPDGSGPVAPGHDPLIGQVAGDARVMDELVPNYPIGNTRSTSNIAQRFVQATGAGYFFMPSIAALSHGPLSQ